MSPGIARPVLMLAAGLAPATRAQRLRREGAIRLEPGQGRELRRLRGRDPQDFYPEEARRKRLDGHVIVDLLINEDGQVLEAQVVSETPPDEGFALAALDVAKTFEFDNPLKQLVLMEVMVSFLP